MIRTVWLAIACLIVLAGLTVLKVGTTAVVPDDAAPVEQTAAANPAGALASDVLPKGDRLDAADEDDAIKPVRPIAITTRVAAAVPAEATGPDEGWRRSYAKREAAGAKYRKASCTGIRAGTAARMHREATASRKPRSAASRRRAARAVKPRSCRSRRRCRPVSQHRQGRKVAWRGHALICRARWT
jgi:hypothetical protein